MAKTGMTTPIRILFVEDSIPDLEQILHVLRKSHFNPQWKRIDELDELRDILSTDEPWDVILCDHSLPGFTSLDALEVVQSLKRDIPFIIVSGIVDEDTAILAMKRGACDFLKKDRLSRLPASITREILEHSNRVQLDSIKNELKVSETYFRLMMEAVRDYAIFMIDIDGRIATWNEGAERLFGHTIDKAIGMSLADLYSPPLNIGENELVSLLNGTRDSGHFEDEAKRRRRDGSEFWAHSVMIPLRESDGELRGYSLITRDIDTRKKDERDLALARSEAHQKALALKASEAERREFEIERKNLNNLFEQSPFFVAVTSGPDHTLNYLNETFLKILGIGRLGQRLHTESEYFGLLHPHIHKVFISGISAHLNEICLNIEGEARYFDFILSVKKNGADLNEGVILLGTEITRQLQARHVAEAASASKSEFLANMSHEIRTPLSAIIGFSEFLKDASLSISERDRYIDTINRNSHALAQIIDDILDMAKIEAGKLEIESIDFSLVNLLTEIVEMFREKSRQKKIFLELRMASELPHFLSSDPTRLRQILFNIVGNAIKFTDRGGVLIEVGLLSATDAGVIIAIEVTDTGRGMTEAQKAKLFQPFVQADNSTTRQYGGTGLGLVLAHRLSVALGGSVSIPQSQPASGTTFRIEFKARVADTASEEPKPEIDILPVLKADKCLDGLRILVVDDTPDNQFLIKRFLIRNGAKVDLATDGSKAVEKAMGDEFDLVLMDIQMPIMDGYQAMALLKSLDYGKPVVALTAHALLEERIKTIKAGFAGYLTKPFDNKTLLDTIVFHTAPLH